jgi:hypothetical protein
MGLPVTTNDFLTYNKLSTAQQLKTLVMNLTLFPSEIEKKNLTPKWFNSEVKNFTGTLDQIREHIPSFERTSFTIPDRNGTTGKPNKNLDTIVRLPTNEDKSFAPVGVVSKDYKLVQHQEVVNMLEEAISSVGIPVEEIKAELFITELGERMSLNLSLPDLYNYIPSDGHAINPRLECTNSVDGSTRFHAYMGWLRLICSNGLMIGVTRSNLYQRHTNKLEIANVQDILTYGLKESEIEKSNFEKWNRRRIDVHGLSEWFDKNLKKEWGFKAAARAYHISMTGYDAEISGSFIKRTPSTIKMDPTIKVPGTSHRCESLFELSQILAWLAKERRDLQEQFVWKTQIPGLLETFMN